MKFHILESGSKGNCTVVQSGESFLIIDCGGTKKYLEKCFSDVGIDYHRAEALLVTHEHSDHIKQIKMFTDLKIYVPDVIEGICEEAILKPLEIMKIGPFTVLPIPLSHDCSHTLGYIIHDGKETIVSVTDTGYVSHSNEELIRGADYYIFESNHDTDMLMNSTRPVYLKDRILSNNGHLCNEDSALVLSRIISDNTKEIVLAHISEECNTPALAYNTLISTLKRHNIDYSNCRISVARQFSRYSGGSEE